MNGMKCDMREGASQDLEGVDARKSSRSSLGARCNLKGDQEGSRRKPLEQGGGEMEVTTSRARHIQPNNSNVDLANCGCLFALPNLIAEHDCCDKGLCPTIL